MSFIAIQAFVWKSRTDDVLRVGCVILMSLIPAILSIVIPITMQGKDGMSYLMKNFADEQNMAKHKLSPTYVYFIEYIVVFSIGKNLLVLCFHFSFNYLLTNRNRSFLVRDMLHLRLRDLHSNHLKNFSNGNIQNVK